MYFQQAMLHIFPLILMIYWLIGIFFGLSIFAVSESISSRWTVSWWKKIFWNFNYIENTCQVKKFLVSLKKSFQRSEIEVIFVAVKNLWAWKLLLSSHFWCLKKPMTNSKKLFQKVFSELLCKCWITSVDMICKSISNCF